MRFVVVTSLLEAGHGILGGILDDGVSTVGLNSVHGGPYLKLRSVVLCNVGDNSQTVDEIPRTRVRGSSKFGSR